MYLKSFRITNFRKFKTASNTIDFVNPKKTTEQYTPSSATTLIVGRNNSGKTSIPAALQQAVKHLDPKGSDFNFDHLYKVLDAHKKHQNCFKTPYMRFKFSIDFSDEDKTNSMQNIVDFVDIKSIKTGANKELKIELRYCVKEVALFGEEVKKLIEKHTIDDNILFREFVKLITNKVKFKQTFHCDGEEVNPSRDFKLSHLIDIKIVSANLDNSQNSLSSVFNKIIKYKLRYDEQKDNSAREKLEDNIFKINKNVTKEISIPHEETVNSVVKQIVDDQHMQVSLRSDLDFDSVFTNLIRYEFKEGNHFIPESQFGLGYSNLMKILGHIIDYVEQYEESDSNSKINVICIEEPENFMHPQMQELFIKHIDKAVQAILGKGKKTINSQLAITTHSSHILNSKIHASNTFDNINYLTNNKKNKAIVVPLNDSKIQGLEGSPHDLNFLKKHIKFKVSDLFFSDAVIIVEGITEEQLIAHYLTEDEELSRKYTSIFNINGAYAHIYEPLLKLLQVPCLIITDIDVKRTETEKKNFQQLTKLEGRTTTNNVLKKYKNEIGLSDTKVSQSDMKEKTVKEITKKNIFGEKINYVSDSNFYVVFQKCSINNYYSTSFEEAFILTNSKNDILNSTLKKVIPNATLTNIIGEDDNLQSLLDNSFQLQKKLSASKSNFANTLIYEMASEHTDKWPSLPKYINDGLNWLKNELSSHSLGGI
jgi:putative ATP-dependent endonuclease of OLD family